MLKLSFFIRLVIFFVIINGANVPVYSEDWIIGSGGDEWIGNTSLDNTTLKYKNIELLNGWDPSNVVHVLSGGNNKILTGTDKKMAIRYTAATSKNVTKIGLLPCCYIPANQPLWRVGLQADNDGVPDGTYLGSGTFGGATIPDEVWFFTTISPVVPLIEGKTYWIVIQYDSGPAPTGSDYWISFYASNPSPPSNDIPLPYNYGGPDKNVNDAGTMAVMNYNGLSWVNDIEGRTLGTFILAFNDSTYHGQPYKHNYISAGGGWEFGQVFKIYTQNKTVDKLASPWNPGHALDQDIKPADDLYYYIKENDYKGKTIASGTFLSVAGIYSGEIDYDSQWYGVGARRWYEKSIPPVTLEKDKTYFLYFNSPGSILSEANWQTDTPNGMAEYESGEIRNAIMNITYDQDDSYVRKTEDNWAHTDTYPSREVSFKLHLANVSAGNLTSITKDAESIGFAGDVWKQIKFEGTTPSGTKVSIFVRSSPDNITYSDWIPVKDNADSSIIYEITAVNQQRYISWRLVLQTDNSSVTPEIYNVTVSTSDSAPFLDAIPPTIAITSPANGSTFTTTVLIVSGNASDNVGLNKVEVKVGVSGYWQTASGTDFWSKDINLVFGSNIIYSRAIDNSGNIKETSVIVTCNALPDGNQLTGIIVYPNPYIKGKSPGEKITFANLPKEAVIKIYSSNGKLIKELSAGSGDKVEWSITDASGGIYLYVITSSEGAKKGKISIIK